MLLQEKYYHILGHVLKWLYIIQMMHIKFPKWQDNSCTVIHGGRNNNVLFSLKGPDSTMGSKYISIGMSQECF